MSEDSVDALKVHAVPFNVHMAGMAERDDIIEGVGIVPILKGADWLDVMYVRCLAGRLLDKTATLTSVVIASSGSTPESSPIRSVVSRVAAAPRRIVFSFAKRIAAIKRTKRKAALSFAPITRVIERLTAIVAFQPMEDPFAFGPTRTGNLRSFALRCVLIWLRNHALCQPHRAASVVTCTATKMASVLALQLGGAARESSSTGRTFKLNPLAQLPGNDLIRTFAATGLLATVLQANGVCQVDSFANRTRPFDELHKRNYS